MSKINKEILYEKHDLSVFIEGNNVVFIHKDKQLEKPNNGENRWFFLREAYIICKKESHRKTKSNFKNNKTEQTNRIE